MKTWTSIICRCVCVCLVVVAVCLLITPSFADDGAMSGDGYITEFYMNASGNLLRVKFSLPIVNPGPCQNSEFYVAELDDTPGSTRFVAILYSAYLEHKKVAFYINGCSKEQWWGATRPKLYDVYLR